MTQDEIQTSFTDSPCVTALALGQLLQLIAILLWRNATGSSTMTLADIQAQFTASPCVGDLATGQLFQLIAMLAESGGGGGGSVAAAGLNYCFSGTAPNQELKIVNTTSGLANTIWVTGNDGDQSVALDPGSAC